MQRISVILRALGLVAVGVFSMAGLPDNGLPDNGLPDNGLPDNGLPDNGLPDNGNSPDALINSPLFFNRATHAYWVGHPFTAAVVGAPGNPLQQAITDPFSAMVMAYQWQLCHPAGDNATVKDRAGKSHVFEGRVGLCVLPGNRGWHHDTPLDPATARWLSAATITQVNRFQVHNRYSLRGPVNTQLTAMASSMTSYQYKFGTHNPVEALGACPAAPPSTGKARCGWKPHWVGVGKAGAKVHLAARTKGVRMLLQVNLGIHAANPGTPGAIAISGAAGKVDPSVDFVVPAGGTFNVQWAADPRPTSKALPATIAPPTLTAVVAGGGKLLFPADEVFVFTNREMYATAMLFNLSAADHNIAPIPGTTAFGKGQVANCEPRINSDGRIQYCDASNSETCIPCTRTPRPGGKRVVFPNAHLWLSASWTKAQDYYALRSCSSDLSSCVANFEGFIDANYCGPANARCTGGGAVVVAKACQVQSRDNDTAPARPYAGPAQKLNDAFKCFIGSGPDTGFGVTTFFANYGTIGACWATEPKRTEAKQAACTAYRGGRPDKDHDKDHDKDRDKDRD